MKIDFFEPLFKGFGRMKKALFQPFDIKKWFIVGFTAFLADLMDFPKKGGGDSEEKGIRDLDLMDILEFPLRAWDWLMENTFWFTLILIGVVILAGIIILLLWLSSRGKFMFLYNVVHDRAEVKKPWHNYKELGNSLFLWRLIFGIVCVSLIIIFLLVSLIFVVAHYDGYYPHRIPVESIVLFALFFVGLILLILYIDILLEDFVVPLMYKYNIRVLQAWSKFLSLFQDNFLYFILYGLLIFVLIVLVIIGVIVFGLMTCCIGFVLLIIPYIGSVVTLPISYTFRAFSIEFLAQFGDEYNVLPEPEKPAPDTQT